MPHDTAFNMAQLNWVDYSIIGIVLASVLISIIRGFVREALSLITWIVAILVAIYFSQDVANLLAPYVKSPKVAFGLSFTLLFILVLILGAIINYLLAGMIHKTGLSFIDRLLGIAIGLIRGVLIVAILMLLCDFTNLPHENAWQQSQLLPYIQPYADWMKQFTPQIVDFFSGT